MSESVPVKFPFINNPPVFKVKAPLITEPPASIVVNPVTVAAIGITSIPLEPKVRAEQFNTPFVPAKVVVVEPATDNPPARVCNALVVRVAVAVIVQLFQVVAPAKVLEPPILKIEPVAVTVPAVLVKLGSV